MGVGRHKLLSNQRAQLPAAFSTGITVPHISAIDPHCYNLCTWIPRKCGGFALKYTSLMCGRHP